MKRISVLPSNDERIYRFIRDYGKTVRLYNIRLFSKIHKIHPQDMGFALKKLREKGRVKISRDYGWYAISNHVRQAELRGEARGEI